MSEAARHKNALQRIAAYPYEHYTDGAKVARNLATEALKPTLAEEAEDALKVWMSVDGIPFGEIPRTAGAICEMRDSTARKVLSVLNRAAKGKS